MPPKRRPSSTVTGDAEAAQEEALPAFKKNLSSVSESIPIEESVVEPTPRKQPAARRRNKDVPSAVKVKKSGTTDSLGETTDGGEGPAKRARKAKAVGPYTQFKESSIPEPELPRALLPEGRAGLRIISWNLGGLRGFLKSRQGDLEKLVERERPDVLALLEHKLQQDGKETEATLASLSEVLPEYELAAISYSTVKKGYSGVLVLMRKGAQQPTSEVTDLNAASNEGRLVILDFDRLYIVVSYVPNSGDGLKRLDERVGKWDVELRERLTRMATQKSVLLIGDLNVAHLDTDIWNVEAPHVPKSAGTTPQERESFGQLLEAGFVDGFRKMHPEALGAFTYWSVRAGNRGRNRGLRLDYAVVSRDMVDMVEGAGDSVQLVDAFHIADLASGDHCAVGALVAM